MALAPVADVAQHGADCARGTLTGGVVAVRLPALVSERLLAAVMELDAAWLVVDLRTVDGDPDVILERVTAALRRSARSIERTCAVLPPRPGAAVATFATLADACQAKLFFDAGFGPGWRATHASSPRLAPVRGT
jgi:hypothetical protein